MEFFEELTVPVLTCAGFRKVPNFLAMISRSTLESYDPNRRDCVLFEKLRSHKEEEELRQTGNAATAM